MRVLHHYWALSEGVTLISTVPEPFIVSCELIRPRSFCGTQMWPVPGVSEHSIILNMMFQSLFMIQGQLLNFFFDTMATDTIFINSDSEQ